MLALDRTSYVEGARLAAMARIIRFHIGNQDVKVHPTEVDCFHQLIDDGVRGRYLHLTTFGSSARASQPKSSQSMQLDRAAARALLRVLHDAFPDLKEEGSASST